MDSPSLAEELNGWIAAKGHALSPHTNVLLAKASTHITALETELERRKYDGEHTCHDECPRTACVLRRRVAELETALDSTEDALCDCHGHLYQGWPQPSASRLRATVELARAALKARGL